MPLDDTKRQTHAWIACPGCGYGGEIGVPLDYPADVVVCPKCRQVINIRPEDRILWRPLDASQFLRRQYPNIDWDSVDAADSQSQNGETIASERGSTVESPPTDSLTEKPIVLSMAVPAQEDHDVGWAGSAVATVLFLVIVFALVGTAGSLVWLMSPAS